LAKMKEKMKIKALAGIGNAFKERSKVTGMVLKIKPSGFVVPSKYQIHQDGGGPPVLVVTQAAVALFFRNPTAERIPLTFFTIEEPRTLIEEEQGPLNKVAKDPGTTGFDLFITRRDKRKRYILVPKGNCMDTWNFLWPYRDHSKLGEAYGSTVSQPRSSVASSSTAMGSTRKSCLGHRSSKQVVLQTDFFAPLEFTCMNGIPMEWSSQWWMDLCQELKIDRNRFLVQQVTTTSVLFGITPTTSPYEPSARKVCDQLRQLKITGQTIQTRRNSAATTATRDTKVSELTGKVSAVSAKPSPVISPRDSDDSSRSGSDGGPIPRAESTFLLKSLDTYTDSYLSFRNCSGKLEIRVIKAIDLPISDWTIWADSIRSSDPYCVIIVPTALNRKETRKTRIVSKCLNPVWDEVFMFDCDYATFHPSFILFTIYDNDIDSDDLLGYGRMSIPFQEPGEVKSYKVSIRASDKEEAQSAGFLFIEALWMPTPQDVGETEAITPRKFCTDPFIPPPPFIPESTLETLWTDEDERHVNEKKAEMILQRESILREESLKEPADIIAVHIILFGCLLVMIILPSVLSVPLALVFTFLLTSAGRGLSEPIRDGLNTIGYDLAKPHPDLGTLYRTWQSVAWLNVLIYQLWPYILSFLERKILVDLPPFLHVDIGPNPPHINAISADFVGTQLNIDVDLQYISSVKVSLYNQQLFGDLQIMSTFRIELSEWIPVPPMIRSVKITLLSPPTIRGGHFTLLPIWMLVGRVAWWVLAWPKRFHLALDANDPRLHLFGRLTIKLVDIPALTTTLSQYSLNPQRTFVKLELQGEERLVPISHLQHVAQEIPSVQPREIVVSLLSGANLLGKPKRISLSETTEKGIPQTRTIFFEKETGDPNRTSSTSNRSSGSTRSRMSRLKSQIFAKKKKQLIQAGEEPPSLFITVRFLV